MSFIIATLMLTKRLPSVQHKDCSRPWVWGLFKWAVVVVPNPDHAGRPQEWYRGATVAALNWYSPQVIDALSMWKVI